MTTDLKQKYAPVAFADGQMVTPPADRRIASKKHAFHLIKRGVIMQLYYDLETGGVDKREAQHPMRGFPVITEYGDALADIAGNYLNSAQIFPRRPEWMMIDPAAPLVQRMSPYEYDSPDRPCFFDAMGMVAARIEQAPYQYSGFGDQTIDIVVEKQFKNRVEQQTKTVIPIPQKLENGDIVYDAFWCPREKKIYHRIDNDPDSRNVKADIHITGADGKTQMWKGQNAVVMIKGFNSARFDNPVLQQNLERAGTHPSNAYLMYSQHTTSHKQKQKNFHMDVRPKLLRVSMHGPQGEEGLHIGTKINPMTGKPYTSESLSTWMQQNQRFTNHIRGVGGGIFLHNGATHDPAADHGAVYDSKCLLAADNYCMDIAPDLVLAMEKQISEDATKDMLSQPREGGKSMPLFALPRRNFPEDHTEGLYLFLNTDEQMGGFKKYVFIHVDGKLSEPKHEGKCMHEMSVSDYVEYFRAGRQGEDIALRTVSYRKWDYPLHFDDIMSCSTQTDGFFADLPAIDEKDLPYLEAHKDVILPRAYSALDILGSAWRFEEGIHTPLAEDEWIRQGFGDISYLDDEIIEERRRLWQERKDVAGPQAVHGIVETVKNKMQADFNFMNKIDKAMMMLCITSLPADYARQKEREEDREIRDLMDAHEDFVNALPTDYSMPEGTTTEDDALDKFNDLAERIYKMLKKEKVPYAAFLADPFEDRSAFQSLKDVEKFRDTLGLKALKDCEHLIKSGKSDFAHGFVDKMFCYQERRGKPLFLFASADRGDKGAVPHVIDGHRRELPVDYLKKQEPIVCIRKMGSGEWQNRFYRLRSDPIYEALVHRFIDRGKRDMLSPFWQKKYDERKRLRLNGAPNETAINSRHSNIRSFEHDCARLALNANARDPAALEREIHQQLGFYNRVMRYDESQRYLDDIIRWGQEIREKHLPEKPKETYGRLYEPETGMPYEYIPYKIPKEDHVILDVPAWHLRHPIRQYDESLPFNCLIIEKPDGETMKQIRRGTKVLLREEETGRTYAPGPLSWHDAPEDGDARFAHLTESARQAYRQGGHELPAGRKRVVIGIENLYPVANTRLIKTATQTLKIPRTHYDGLVYPEMSGLEQPLTGLVVPLDYCPQQLEPQARLRLREMQTRMFENIQGEAHPDTGHVYDTHLKEVIGVDGQGQKTGITLRNLFNDISSGRISEKIAAECGFLGRDHMENRLMEWSVGRWGDDFYDEKVLLVRFNKTQKRHWAYFNPPETPVAAMTTGGHRTPPSAYQDRLSPRILKKA